MRLHAVLGLRAQNKGKAVGREAGIGTQAGRLGSEGMGSVLSRAHSFSTHLIQHLLCLRYQVTAGDILVSSIQLEDRNFPCPQKVGYRQVKLKCILKNNECYEGRPTEFCEQHISVGQTAWRGQGGSTENMKKIS